MIDEAVKVMIKRHEGRSRTIYLDTVGVPTGGYGHAFHIDSSLPDEVINLLFDWDYERHAAEYPKLNLPDIGPVRKAVVLDMLFNLGFTRLRGFRKFLSALHRLDFNRAADEMIDSKWYRQVGHRGRELEQMMRKGLP